jgi:hypothetical protein
MEGRLKLPSGAEWGQFSLQLVRPPPASLPVASPFLMLSSLPLSELSEISQLNISQSHMGIFIRLSCPNMGVWKGVAMDSLKYRKGPPCSTLLHPVGRVTPETTLQLLHGWPAHRASNWRLCSTPLDTPRRMPM